MRHNNCCIPDEVKKAVNLSFLIIGFSVWTETSYNLCFFPCFSSGALHDPLPFLLPVARSRRLHAPVQRQRPADAAVGQRVQVSTVAVLRVLPLQRGFSPRRKKTFDSFCSKFDLYTKTTDLPDVDTLKPYYQSLIDKYCPGVLQWWSSRNQLWSNDVNNDDVMFYCSTKADQALPTYHLCTTASYTWQII